MGSYVSNFASMSNTAVHNVCRGRKRKCIEEYNQDTASEFYRIRQTPKKRKLLTAQYIYRTLFQEGKGSDITVLILGKAWRLHKIYISQSPYFASMFSGLWKEANEKVVSVEITDPNITQKSLSVVLGSLYLDEVSLEPQEIVAILATSTLFQLQGLIDECADVMVETTNIETAVSYYNAAVSYGVPTVKTVAKRWLEVNLLAGRQHDSLLKEITPDLMTELLTSPDLIVINTEFCIYWMLRSWLFVQTCNEEKLKIDEYFQNRPGAKPFLKTDEGKKYATPFKALRLKYLVLNEYDIKCLSSDNIIPPDWLFDVYREHWLHLLRIELNKDRGPVQMTDEEFSKECFRCGRHIENPGGYVWKWKEFQYGLDLQIHIDMTSLRIERKFKEDSENIMVNYKEHNIMLKICLFSLDEQQQVKYVQQSNILKLCLKKNMKVQVISLDKHLTYPLYVFANLQVVTPFASKKEKKSTDILLDT